MRQAGEHTPPLWLEQACATPDPRGQTYVHHPMAGVMLPYLSFARNSLHMDLPPGWQGVWVVRQHCRGRSLLVAVAWDVLCLASPTRIRRSLQVACRTPMRLSMALLHVTRPYPNAALCCIHVVGSTISQLVLRTYWRNTSHLLERHPRTYRRNTSYLLERKYYLTFCS